MGKTSLLLCEAFTWSLGWTRVPSREARVAMTSLAFMLLDVPDPVWKTSSGNWSSWFPAVTSAAAAAMRSAISGSTTPSWLLTRAAAPLIRPRACTTAGSIGVPEMGKFSIARWVWAWYSASRGTRTSPIVSCSIRYASASGCVVVSSSVLIAPVCRVRPRGGR